MRSIIFTIIFCIMQPLQAAIESRVFENPVYESRYYQMIDKLRCLVCQNQNLADSNSELARDLRDKTYELIAGGATNNEISEFMVTRYGQFVLYEPPVNSHTLILWGAPVVFAIIGIFVFVRVSRKSKSTTLLTVDANHVAQARDLLKDKSNNS